MSKTLAFSKKLAVAKGMKCSIKPNGTLSEIRRAKTEAELSGELDYLRWLQEESLTVKFPTGKGTIQATAIEFQGGGVIHVKHLRKSLLKLHIESWLKGYNIDFTIY